MSALLLADHINVDRIRCNRSTSLVTSFGLCLESVVGCLHKCSSGKNVIFASMSTSLVLLLGQTHVLSVSETEG